MMPNGVLLDTSFFLRFLNEDDPLFKYADGYFKYFLEKEIPMAISTISIAEYCVGGDIHELPLRNLQVVPFNISHAKRTGELAKLVFNNKNKLQLTNRNIIPNDSKLFAQADREPSIAYYLTSDAESKKIYDLLVAEGFRPQFQFMDLHTPFHEFFGLLDL